jgi:hypothetical protein
VVLTGEVCDKPISTQAKSALKNNWMLLIQLMIQIAGGIRDVRPFNE